MKTKENWREKYVELESPATEKKEKMEMKPAKAKKDLFGGLRGALRPVAHEVGLEAKIALGEFILDRAIKHGKTERIARIQTKLNKWKLQKQVEQLRGELQGGQPHEEDLSELLREKSELESEIQAKYRAGKKLGDML